MLGVNVPLSESYALYDMLEKNPGYDFIMYPQISTKSKGVPFIYQTVEIKAVARLGKFTGPAVKSAR